MYLCMYVCQGQIQGGVRIAQYFHSIVSVFVKLPACVRSQTSGIGPAVQNTVKTQKSVECVGVFICYFNNLPMIWKNDVIFVRLRM